ncbi:MAG: hypothetical protein ABFD97_09320 [Syntrophobacter sp.]
MSNQSSEKNHANPGNSRKILMVGKGTVFSEEATEHCVHLAERLEYDLVALNIDTRLQGSEFARCAAESGRALRSHANSVGVHWEQLVRTGDFEQVIEDTIQEIKRVELVVMDLDQGDEEVRDLTVPAISVVTNRRKGACMATQMESTKTRMIARTAAYGALSAACYAAVFTHTDVVMQSFTRGGLYAALPIATVLAVSFVHGAFAHNFWSLLGIEAFKKNRVRRTEQKVIEKRNQLRKRPRLYTHVNPFHRMDV